MLAQGACDIVGAARQSLADPDWFRKISLGLGEQMRVCEYTNYCEGLDQKHVAGMTILEKPKEFGAS
jgi:2,4-dienoyl-CoA reductase-like NADH-dependent reductase (Old Yellow Enzyme family)